LSNCFDKLTKNPKVFIMGDFNCNMNKRYTLCSLVNEFCKAKDLNQLVTEPTRVTKDLIFLKLPLRTC